VKDVSLLFLIFLFFIFGGLLFNLSVAAYWLLQNYYKKKLEKEKKSLCF